MQLHLPPPDISTFLSTRVLFSMIVTDISGRISFMFMAAKKPAAPPPIMAAFMCFCVFYVQK